MVRLATAIALIVLATARPLHAQPPPPPVPPPPIVAAPPPVVAPPIQFPLPPLMTPPAGGLPPLRPESPPFRTFTPLYTPGTATVYGPFPFFGYGVAGDPAERKHSSRSRPQVAAPATGLLRLAVTPGTAQVFVDSYYVGTVDDINAQRFELEAGPHRIELRAPQYESQAVDIRILPFDTVTYRVALEPTRTAAPATPPATGRPTPMYVIPNCYLGNIPPRPSRLVAGCDIKKVQVLGGR